MKLFNFHIMTEGLFRTEKRKAEKVGHRVALFRLRDADKVIIGGHYVFRGKVIKEKLVFIGDDNYIMDNSFEGVGLELV